MLKKLFKSVAVQIAAQWSRDHFKNGLVRKTRRVGITFKS